MLESGEPTQLTNGKVYDDLDPRWAPDGELVVFCFNHADDPDLDPDADDIFVISAKGGEPRRIETPIGPKQRPVFSPDGEWIAYLGKEGRGEWWKNTGLWVVPVNGSGEARDLTGSFDVHVGSATINDLPGGLPLSPPTWSKHGSRIYVQVSERGLTILKSVTLDTSEQDSAGNLANVAGGDGVLGPLHLDEGQSMIAYLHTDLMEPAEVWMHDLTEGTSRKLSHVNEELLDEIDLGSVEEVWFEGAAGNDLQGWILKPPRFDAFQRHPTILEIHGGPRVQYGQLFMHEFFFLAAQGYVVAFCNPRGGRGYGEEHAKAIWNSWGTGDYDDLMACGPTSSRKGPTSILSAWVSRVAATAAT